MSVDSAGPTGKIPPEIGQESGHSHGADPASKPAGGQPGNPLHGVTLEVMVTALAGHYGWEGLGERINIRCFTSDPSVASSLKFLRKTPWAREKVESLYLYMLREIRRAGPVVHNFPPPRK